MSTEAMSARVGVLIAGLNGASANTMLAGSMGTNDVGARRLGSIIHGAGLGDHGLFADETSFVFGGWDVDGRTAADAATTHGILPVVDESTLERLGEIRPFPAYVGSLDTAEALQGGHTLSLGSAADAVAAVVENIQAFQSANAVDRCVVLYYASPLRRWQQATADLDETRLDELLHELRDVPSGLVYALAAIRANCAFGDLTPNITLEVPAILSAAERYGMPLAGRDLSTGETLLKLILGDMLRRRNLKLQGWYSANILGNADGRILSRPEHRSTKLEDKLSSLPKVLGYSDFDHVVDITYYPPRGDAKESWESVDFLGWLGLPMSMKINWQGRDSVLAAPLALDVVKHLDFALRHGERGLLGYVGAYFKRPLGCDQVPFHEALTNLRKYYLPYYLETPRDE
jgi:myo-inositol-1-phosphate synthase